MGFFVPINDNDGWTSTYYEYVSNDSITTMGLVAFALLSSPIIFLFFIAHEFCIYLKEHLLTYLIIYFVISFLIGLVLYRNKRIRNRGFGIVATVATMTPLALNIILNCTPNMVTNPNFGTCFSVAVILFITFGIEIFVMSMARLQRDGIKHFVYAIISILLSIIFNFVCSNNLPEIISFYG